MTNINDQHPSLLPKYVGETYAKHLDETRLDTQIAKVYRMMKRSSWTSLAVLSTQCDCSEASVSARLRDLRKPQWGGHDIDKKRMEGGLWAYKMTSDKPLLDGKRAESLKSAARKRIEAFLAERESMSGMHPNIIATVGGRSGIHDLTVTDLREMIR